MYDQIPGQLVGERNLRPLRYISQEADGLYDYIIRKLVPKMIGRIYSDSLDKVGHVGEGSQGYDVYSICLEYSRSKEMESTLMEQKILGYNQKCSPIHP
jgi:hypothetical protein